MIFILLNFLPLNKISHPTHNNHSNFIDRKFSFLFPSAHYICWLIALKWWYYFLVYLISIVNLEKKQLFFGYIHTYLTLTQSTVWSARNLCNQPSISPTEQSSRHQRALCVSGDDWWQVHVRPLYYLQNSAKQTSRWENFLLPNQKATQSVFRWNFKLIIW